jgi:hypothetical protein
VYHRLTVVIPDVVHREEEGGGILRARQLLQGGLLCSDVTFAFALDPRVQACSQLLRAQVLGGLYTHGVANDRERVHVPC